MTTDTSIVSMAHLAGSMVELDLPHNFHSWAHSLTLIIGDSPVDRLCYWNSRLLYASWLLHGLTPLRIPEARLDDGEFIDALVNFVARRNWLNASGGGVWQIALRSASVDPASLVALAARLGQATHVRVVIEPISSVLDCVPTEEKLEETQFQKRDQPSQFVLESPFSLDCPLPRHLIDAAPVPPALRLGCWGADVKVERHDVQSPYANVKHWWKLPRRWEILRLFTSKGRINRLGKISVFPEEFPQEGGTRVQFTIPASDDQAVMSLFVRNLFDRRHTVSGPSLAASSYRGVTPWDKGRYLRGVVGLFGSLATAYEVLGNGFWQKTFMEMASPSKNRSDVKRRQILQALKPAYKRLSRTETVNSDENWASLVDAMVKVVPNQLKNPLTVIGYDDLLQKWKKDLADYLDGEASLQPSREEIESEAEARLKISIENRCQEGVFTQGHRWTCRQCAHANWSSIDSMARVLTCAVCRTQTPLPADFRWHFYMNDFLADGLREHGLLGLVWSLGHLQWRAEESFFFVPPLGLFRSIPQTRRAPPNKEVDICCVVDGIFIIGEVKEFRSRYQ